jgi:MFS superfamily sulfate permease-like transporter
VYVTPNNFHTITSSSPLPGNWAVAKKFADQKKYSVSPSSEMVAYGLSNLVGSFFSSYVVAGGFARSAVNAEGGAVTPLAGGISGVCILISLQFLTTLFYFVPLATLAAIIVVSVVSMMDFQRIVLAYKRGFYQDCVVILATALVTFFVGVSVGLICGMAMSVIALLYSTSSAQFTTMSTTTSSTTTATTAATNTDYYCNGNDTESNATFSNRLSNENKSLLCSFQMSSMLYFGNLESFKSAVQEASDSLLQALVRDGTALSASSSVVLGCVVLDARSWGHYLELPCAEAIEELRLVLLTPRPLPLPSSPPFIPPVPSSTEVEEKILSTQIIKMGVGAGTTPPLVSVSSSHSADSGLVRTLIVKLGLVNCHPSVLQRLAALGIVERIGTNMIFQSTEDLLLTDMCE